MNERIEIQTIDSFCTKLNKNEAVSFRFAYLLSDFSLQMNPKWMKNGIEINCLLSNQNNKRSKKTKDHREKRMKQSTIKKGAWKITDRNHTYQEKNEDQSLTTWKERKKKKTRRMWRQSWRPSQTLTATRSARSITSTVSIFAYSPSPVPPTTRLIIIIRPYSVSLVCFLLA